MAVFMPGGNKIFESLVNLNTWIHQNLGINPEYQSKLILSIISIFILYTLRDFLLAALGRSKDTLQME
jgi:uncharacterized membrane protein YwzB